jgi:hypothetical protein
MPLQPPCKSTAGRCCQQVETAESRPARQARWVKMAQVWPLAGYSGHGHSREGGDVVARQWLPHPRPKPRAGAQANGACFILCKRSGARGFLFLISCAVFCFFVNCKPPFLPFVSDCFWVCALQRCSYSPPPHPPSEGARVDRRVPMCIYTGNRQCKIQAGVYSLSL